MRNIWKLLAVIAVAGGFAACDKDKVPEVPTDFSGGCEAVDLGLSVKWAPYNVGALNVDDRGSYFAWGETSEKSNYDWANEGDYKWGIYDSSAWPKYGMTKYTGDVQGGDGLYTLQPGDDPATANWGTKWRTPTLDEFVELFDETKCEWKWDGTREGYIVKGLATGNSIFLPAAGYRNGSDLNNAGEGCFYWPSSMDPESLKPCQVHAFVLEPSRLALMELYRRVGLSVRAVTEY